MTSQAFDRFGELFVKNVRDTSIVGWINTIKSRGNVTYHPSKEDIQSVTASEPILKLNADC